MTFWGYYSRIVPPPQMEKLNLFVPHSLSEGATRRMTKVPNSSVLPKKCRSRLEFFPLLILLVKVSIRKNLPLCRKAVSLVLSCPD